MKVVRPVDLRKLEEFGPLQASCEERRLIEALRAHHGWGEATVVLKDGRPVMLRGLREDVKLTDGD